MYRLGEADGSIYIGYFGNIVVYLVMTARSTSPLGALNPEGKRWTRVTGQHAFC